MVNNSNVTLCGSAKIVQALGALIRDQKKTILMYKIWISPPGSGARFSMPAR
jgi:hypothetical protein